MLTELDYRLSVVKRWGILNTIQTQSVAEHCFNVERICMKLAPMFGITDFLGVLQLSQAALHHDDQEALTGDMPTTAKHYIEEGESGVDMPGRLWYTQASDRTREIVKLADLLEAFHFINMEIKMGNKYLIKHKAGAKARILEFAMNHPDWPTKVFDECVIWMRTMENSQSQIYA